MRRFEASLRRKGFAHVAGVDEAGRGPLAGPVVAAAVVLRPRSRLAGLADSKSLTPARRRDLFQAILGCAEALGVGIATSREIDRTNVLQAAWAAMLEAIQALRPAPDMVLVDGWPIPGLPFPQRGIIRGDQSCASIAAASIVAKVARDRLMCALDSVYPGYGFAQHKGYCTARHVVALRRLGACPIHRKTFAPLSACKQNSLAMA
jgi:ribonuclease HII